MYWNYILSKMFGIIFLSDFRVGIELPKLQMCNAYQVCIFGLSLHNLSLHNPIIFYLIAWWHWIGSISSAFNIFF